MIALENYSLIVNANTAERSIVKGLKTGLTFLQRLLGQLAFGDVANNSSESCWFI